MLIFHDHEVLSSEPIQGVRTPYKFHPGCVYPYSRESLRLEPLESHDPLPPFAGLASWGGTLASSLPH